MPHISLYLKFSVAHNNIGQIENNLAWAAPEMADSADLYRWLVTESSDWNYSWAWHHQNPQTEEEPKTDEIDHDLEADKMQIEKSQSKFQGYKERSTLRDNDKKILWRLTKQPSLTFTEEALGSF